MEEETLDEYQSESDTNGGETVEKETTESPTGKDWQKIAEDQKRRAEKAEAKLEAAIKAVSKTEEIPQEKVINNTESPEFLTRDEGILIAKGYSDEAIAHAKKIAKGADVPLLDALNDPLMTAFLEKEAEDKKRQEAKLGASNGSGVTPTKSVPLDEKEHKEFWKEQMGI